MRIWENTFVVSVQDGASLYNAALYAYEMVLKKREALKIMNKTGSSISGIEDLSLTHELAEAMKG